MECDCEGNGVILSKNCEYESNVEKSETPIRVNELMKWEHHSSPFHNGVLEVGISFMFIIIILSLFLQIKYCSLHLMKIIFFVLYRYLHFMIIIVKFIEYLL